VLNPHTSTGNDSRGTAEYDDMAMLTPEEMKDFAIQHIIQIQGTLKVTQRQNEEIQREHNTLKALLDQFQADSQWQLDSLWHDNQALWEDLQILQGYKMPDAIWDLTKQARDQWRFSAQVKRASSKHCTLLQEQVTELETANENTATEKAELLDLVHELKDCVERVEDSHHDTGLGDRIGQLELDLEQVQLSGLEIADRQYRLGQVMMDTQQNYDNLESRVAVLEKASSSAKMTETLPVPLGPDTSAPTPTCDHAPQEDLESRVAVLKKALCSLAEPTETLLMPLH
jgi:hypothetical protein